MEDAFFQSIVDYFRRLQEELCASLRDLDAELEERRDRWDRPGGGCGISRAISEGRIFEKGGVNFSDVRGDNLPPSATAARPELSGKPFRASGVSVVIHPRSPYVPSTHMNVRCFRAGEAGEPEGKAWFGGGFDLTPFYPFHEDVLDWHRSAREACRPFGDDLYPRFRKWCDAYFHLPHRGETRGVGGLFFDDLDELGDAGGFAFTRSVGDAFWPAYETIVRRRKDRPWGDRERRFQMYRRGRYVEFNLLYDRGTLFGLQSGGRTESILMSMPPVVRWEYGWDPAPDSPEAELYRNYLKPRDWLKDDECP